MLKYKIIDETEYGDFKSVLKENGREEEDFELDEEEDEMVGTGIQPISGRVTVTCKNNSKSKTYEAGHCTSWVAEFRKDLISGFYK